MFKTRNVLSILTVLVAVTVLMFANGCKKDDDPAKKTVFDLMVKDVLGVTGKATFIETSSTMTTIEIQLFGAPAGSHPASLCMNSAVEGGSVVFALNPVVDNGISSTKVAMTYTQLIAYDGFIKVSESTNAPNVLLALGDIGGNVITTSKKSYTLQSVDAYQVSGTALLEKRVNGSTLITIALIGTIAGETYPSSINLSSTTTIGGGPVVNILSNVDGTTGVGYTNIRKLDSGTDITYENWLGYDGHINIYQTSILYDNIICQGNIGSN